jgi:hypothetical protein
VLFAYLSLVALKNRYPVATRMDLGGFMMNQIQDGLDCLATDAINGRLALRSHATNELAN